MSDARNTSDDRELVFARIRSALSAQAARAPMPEYPADIAVATRVLAGKTRIAAFSERLERVNGRVFEETVALATWLAERGALHGYIDPALYALLSPAFSSVFTLETELFRDRIDDYAFGITRAAGAIAETGSVILNDAVTSRRLAALAPWIHVAVVRRADLFRDVGQAIAALGDDPNVIWCTGPSKTADVEGILIEGVHGPGEQVALFVPSF